MADMWIIPFGMGSCSWDVLAFNVLIVWYLYTNRKLAVPASSLNFPA